MPPHWASIPDNFRSVKERRLNAAHRLAWALQSCCHISSTYRSKVLKDVYLDIFKWEIGLLLLDISGWKFSIFTQVWIAFQQEASLVGTSMWQKLTSDEGNYMDVVWTWTCEYNHCNVKRQVFKLPHESKIWRKYLIEKGLFKCRGNRKSFESGLWMVTQLAMFIIFHDGYTDYTALSWLQDWWKRSLSLALRSFYPVWANFGRTGCAVAIALALDCMSRGYPWIVSACFDASIYWRMEQQGCKDNNMLDFWKTVIIFLQQ